MQTNVELFKESVDRLIALYHNDNAKLEAVDATSKIALEAFGDVAGLSGPIGTTTVDTKPHHAQPKTKITVEPTQSQKPNARTLAGAMTLIRKWAKSDPVGCQQWVNKTLTKDIENAASTQFGNLSDDWRKAFDEEVSGEADKAREKVNEKLKKNESKKAADDAAAAKKAGEKEAKSKEKEFWKNQKKLDKDAKKQKHKDALAKMDEEDEKYETDRADLEKYGKDPEMYSDTKKRGVFNKLGRGLKRMWHKLNEAAEQAIRDGDMAKLESIKAQIIDMKTLCESAGIDLEGAILG